MSVINQMLKDLDERQTDQSANTIGSTPAALTPQKSNKKSLIIIVLVVLLINAVGLYVWDLYQENQLLKTNETQQNNTLATVVKPQEQAQVSIDERSNSISTLDKLTTPEKTEIQENLVSNQVKDKVNTIIADEPQLTIPMETPVAKQLNQRPLNSSDKKVPKDFTRQIVKNKSSIQTRNTVITPIQQNTFNNDIDDPQEEIKKPSLTISRRKLSPELLAQQKLERAERAINNNEIEKAEKLLEEVLLLSPEHKSARKQLGALWFGRQLYRPAVNLLSRGIDLHPRDTDFRLMKARILLNQQNNTEAFNVLNGFSTAQHVEYQVLLANTSQLLKRNESAILAYQQLVAMENHKGKWLLGLAVALDRDSQFSEAKTAYNNALTKHDLSDDSADFIRQRLSELGD